jgi:exopolyphosphatase/pppGpp-phosphohydrolase
MNTHSKLKWSSDSFKTKILIDIGSSTVKIYKKNPSQPLKFLETKTFHFKQDFDPSKGINIKQFNDLCIYINDIKQTYRDCIYKTYATAVWRKLEKDVKKKTIDEFFDKTGIFLNIISHELENFYLYTGVVRNIPKDTTVLLINIGGGSTELAEVKNGKIINKANINIGVGTVLSKFPHLNDMYSKEKVETVITEIKNQLPKKKFSSEIAIYTGGELTYMRVAKYPLKENVISSNDDHPSCITLKDFQKRNKEIFSEVTIDELESFMPKDPKWMHGARACSAIAQAICEQYQITTIIPSDLNTIDGVSIQEFQTVTLSGSFRKHLDYFLNVKEHLEQKNIKIMSPRFESPKNPGEEFVIFDGEEGMTPLELERYHLDCIEKSDTLIVCNPNGYVGASAMIEIGLAAGLGKRIIFTEKPEEFMLNTLPAQIGL